MARIVESLKRLSVENEINSRSKNKSAATAASKHLAKSKGEFTKSFEETVSEGDQNYVLGLCGTQCDTDFRVGVSLSDHNCLVYTVGERLCKIAQIKHNDSPIVGIKFSSNSKNIIYIASNNGLVSACDLRAKGKVVAEFKDNTEDGKLKPLASFDLHCDERLVAGGTEHIGGDAFILFWDVRFSHSKLHGRDSLLGGYWESHMDDITSLTFHPNNMCTLASGSTDGLINVFDLKQTSEDQALQSSLNTESSVDRIGWLTNDNLWCITHTHCLQLWSCEDAVPYSKFDRSDLASSPGEDPDNCYLVRMHAPTLFGNPYLLAGSSSTKGEFLKCLSVDQSKLELYYSLSDNKQIVRDSWLHEKSGCLVTGGEGGILNVWNQSEIIYAQGSENNKRSLSKNVEKSRNDKSHRTKPY